MLAKIGRILLRIVIVLGLILLAVQAFTLRGTRGENIHTSNSHVRYSSVPTLVIPGWGGNSWTYQKLIRQVQQKNIAHKTLTVWVSPSGHVHFQGRLDHHNPIIQLLYVWNYTPTYHSQIKQTRRVMVQLHQKYGVNKMNVIAHSYGGTEWLHAYIGSKYLQQKIAFPKVILLGTPVDETFGEKTRFTRWLFKRSHDANFKLMEKQIKQTSLIHLGTIYNWMGSTGRRRTDGEVPHIQSEMMRTLISNKHVHYSETVYPHTSHIELHQKNVILNRIFRILWYK